MPTATASSEIDFYDFLQIDTTPILKSSTSVDFHGEHYLLSLTGTGLSTAGAGTITGFKLYRYDITISATPP